MSTISQNSTTDLNGKVTFNKGAFPQLMTPTFMIFIWGYQPVMNAIQAWNPAIGFIFAFVVFLIWFCHDRAFLASQGAFVPHWLWFLFVPVYIYKRQKRNGNSRWWVVFWLISVLMGLVVSAATMAVFHPQGY